MTTQVTPPTQSAETRTVAVWPVGNANGHQLHEAVGGSVYASTDGKTPVGVAWGPAADSSGNWFARRGETDPIRVDDRAAAIQHITGQTGGAA